MKKTKKKLLSEINQKSYPAYKILKGSYSFPKYLLGIDHVQGDPFASPSKVHISIPLSSSNIPSWMYEKSHLRIALQDFLLRNFSKCVSRTFKKPQGSGKSGLLFVSNPKQEILNRSSCQIHPSSGDLTLRFELGFPANGRRILSKELERILFELLPPCVEQSCFYKNLNVTSLNEFLTLTEEQRFLREELEKQQLSAFIANGSILPRESGVSNRPLLGAIPFISPKSMETSFSLPSGKEIVGMGIPKGIVLIVGGGYHGKSTLLSAIERGVYNHIPGDGREYVITNSTGIKVRSEDGRCVKKVNISPFIQHLPNLKDTTTFSTDNASGSTSVAASVIEAIEGGSSLLLVDEDTTATNFMIRDDLMKEVVHPDKEPITPFLDRIQHLYQEHGVSTILVAGSSGAYFHVADCVLQMDTYEAKEITKLAKDIASNYPRNQKAESFSPLSFSTRIPKANPDLQKGKRIKVKHFGTEELQLNHNRILLGQIEQLVDEEQVMGIAHILLFLEQECFSKGLPLEESIEKVMRLLDTQGFSSIIHGAIPPRLAIPRKEEVLLVLNRYRGLHL